MKNSFRLATLVLCLCPLAGFSQAPRLPRDPDKLIARAQMFWANIAAGQRLKALEFVLPEKKDAFISGDRTPLAGVRVTGLNLTSDPEVASVRIEADMVIAGFSAGRSTWPLLDKWVWRENNWYTDVADDRDLFKLSAGTPAANTEQLAKEIDQALRFQTELNLGTVIHGQLVQLRLPVEYSGKLPLSVRLKSPLPSFTLAAQNLGLTSTSPYVFFSFQTDGWDGPVNVPLRVEFKYEDAFVERSLLVRGSVFSPLSFRQVPAEIQKGKTETVSVFVRNNTGEPITVRYVSVQDRVNTLKSVSVMEPHQEAEFVFGIRPDIEPTTFSVVPKQPVQGTSEFAYKFRVGR